MRIHHSAFILQRFIIHTLFARGIATALNFFMVLAIARHAGPAIKGEVTLLITTTWFFIFLSNILGGQALIYLIPRNKIELLVVPAYIWTVIVAAIGYIFLKSTDIIHANHITSITILSLLYSLITIHQTILLAKQQITYSNMLQIVTLLLQAIGILICFYSLHISDAFAYIYASLAAYSFTVLASYFIIRKFVHFSGFVKDFNSRELVISFRYGFLYQLVELLQLLNLRYYFFQLGLQEGSQYLGIYSIGIAILEAVWIIPRSISTVQYVSTSNTEEVTRASERTVQLVKISLALSAVAIFFIFLIPPSVYIFVFGEGFRYTRHSMRFLFPGIFIYNLLIVISSFYFGIGKYKQLILANLAGFLSLVIFSYFLIPQYVMTGAGLAATLSFLAASGILLLFFISDNKIRLSKFIITRNDLTVWSNRLMGKA